MEPFSVLDNIIRKFSEILESNLTGVYLHGSLAMGCFTGASDIDFLGVVKEALDVKTKRELIAGLLTLNDLPQNGIEMSIILEKHAKEFIYPTPFELHYSNSHREHYLRDENYVCGNMTDKDLAAHMMIIKHRGKCLYGKEIDEVFCEVPRDAYIDSIICDIEGASKDILESPVYMTLNLCRVLYFLKEGAICSKMEGGLWGREALPQQFRDIVEDAVKVYTNQIDVLSCDEGYLLAYAEHMLKEINSNK